MKPEFKQSKSFGQLLIELGRRSRKTKAQKEDQFELLTTSFTRAILLKGKNTKFAEITKWRTKKGNIKHILIGFGHIFRPYYKYYLNVFAYIREKT